MKVIYLRLNFIIRPLKAHFRLDIDVNSKIVLNYFKRLNLALFEFIWSDKKAGHFMHKISSVYQSS